MKAHLNRRQTLLTLGGSAYGVLAAREAEAALPSSYPHLVPEIFANLSIPPSYTPNLIIGSGFGGAISALRLAAAGQSVTVVERGFRWPRDPWRDIFSNDTLPDGRAFWFKKSAKMISGVTSIFDSFGGIVDATVYDTMRVWRAACVGGGSMVFTGCMIQPERPYFEALFGSNVSYDELDRVYYPRVRQMLNLRTIPDDLYANQAFAHSREWDRQARAAGYQPVRSESIFNWDVVRAETGVRSRASATVGCSNHGNSNGAKFDLNQNYLKQAEATGKAKVFAGFEVSSIGHDGVRYVVQGILRDPYGRQLGSTAIACDRLFLAAGSVGTSELLVKARAEKTLRNLNEHVGEGWGTNGDVLVLRSLSRSFGTTDASPSASRIHDVRYGLPTTLENWYVPGLPINITLIPSLGMVFDQSNRGRFLYKPDTKTVTLDWPKEGNADALTVCRNMNAKIAAASGTVPGAPPFFGSAEGQDFTAHPLGGAVIGKATDAYGRVHGHPGLYVMDGALIPGSTGAVNPSLTISALAERNIEAIIRAGA